MREVVEEQMQDTINLISRALQHALLDIRFIDQNKAKKPISMAKMRLLTELVVLAIEDIQTKCLQKEQGKDISVHLRALHDAMNKARYFLNHLESSDGRSWLESFDNTTVQKSELTIEDGTVETLSANGVHESEGSTEFY